jgi:hypothetical protein
VVAFPFFTDFSVFKIVYDIQQRLSEPPAARMKSPFKRLEFSGDIFCKYLPFPLG